MILPTRLTITVPKRDTRFAVTVLNDELINTYYVLTAMVATNSPLLYQAQYKQSLDYWHCQYGYSSLNGVIFRDERPVAMLDSTTQTQDLDGAHQHDLLDALTTALNLLQERELAEFEAWVMEHRYDGGDVDLEDWSDNIGSPLVSNGTLEYFSDYLRTLDVGKVLKVGLMVEVLTSIEALGLTVSRQGLRQNTTSTVLTMDPEDVSFRYVSPALKTLLGLTNMTSLV